MNNDPAAKIDPRFSSPEAKPTPWTEGRRHLEEAEIYWLSTVRPDGQPHVTPLVGVSIDGAVYFCTGSNERKTRNLQANAKCVVTTGANALNEGLDVVVEGDAVQVTDNEKLQGVASAYAAKYEDPIWHFKATEGGFGDENDVAPVYEVTPKTAFGFARGATFSQTRWRF